MSVFLIIETYSTTGFNVLSFRLCIWACISLRLSCLLTFSSILSYAARFICFSSYLLHQVLKTWLNIEEIPCLKMTPSSCVNTSSQVLATICNKSDMYSYWPGSSVVCSILLCLHICWRYIRKRLQNSHQMAFHALLAHLTLGCGIRYCISSIPTMQPKHCSFSTISCV